MANSGNSRRLVYFGNERLVSGLAKTDAPVLRRLLSDGYDIAAVVAHHSEGRSRDSRALEVAEIAQTHGIPVLTPVAVRDISDTLRGFDAIAGILVAYGQIIPQTVIDLFPKGIINVHPSLLPRYRGPTPIETAVAAGDTETGVSIMALAAKMDAGPVYAQTPVIIAPTDTKFDVYSACVQAAADTLSATLPGILAGDITSIAQDEALATYSRLFTKDDAWLDPASVSAEQAERLVRARLGYPKTKVRLFGHDTIILATHVGSDGPLTLQCAHHTVLTIDELVAPSGKTMSGADFLRGYGASLRQ